MIGYVTLGMNQLDNSSFSQEGTTICSKARQQMPLSERSHFHFAPTPQLAVLQDSRDLLSVSGLVVLKVDVGGIIRYQYPFPLKCGCSEITILGKTGGLRVTSEDDLLKFVMQCLDFATTEKEEDSCREWLLCPDVDRAAKLLGKEYRSPHTDLGLAIQLALSAYIRTDKRQYGKMRTSISWCLWHLFKGTANASRSALENVSADKWRDIEFPLGEIHDIIWGNWNWH